MTFAAPFSRVITRPFGGVPASGGWWLSGGIAAANCVAAYQAKGAGSLAASYVNLTGNATYNITATTTPSFSTANGWEFAGASSQYLKTGVIPSGDWSMIIRYSDWSSGGYLIASRSSGYNGFVLGSSGGAYQAWNGTILGWGTFATPGTIAIAGKRFYTNGTYRSTIGAGALSTVALYIGCLNSNGSPTGYLTGYVQAVAIYNTTLTDQQVSDLTTAMNAL